MLISTSQRTASTSRIWFSSSGELVSLLLQMMDSSRAAAPMTTSELGVKFTKSFSLPAGTATAPDWACWPLSEKMFLGLNLALLGSDGRCDAGVGLAATLLPATLGAAAGGV